MRDSSSWYTTLSCHRPGAVPEDGLREVREARDLVLLLEPGVDVVVWPRAPEAALRRDASQFLEHRDAGFALWSTATEDTLAALTSRLPHEAALAHDLSVWAELFRELTGCAGVGLRVAGLDRPMCPRFHVDHVTVRLVITYVGPGTEYVSRSDVNPDRLGHRAGAVADEASGLLRSDSRIYRAAPADVVLLKGTAWPGNAARGAVHRSPSVPTGCRRLVATFDALD